MDSFKDRQNAFETKYAHDQDTRFRIEARATKLLGLWAAQEIGMDTEAAKIYAGDLVAFNLKEPGLNDVIGKVSADLTEKGRPADAVASMLTRFLHEAEEQIKAA
ncbi:MAG: DUF1476 domain-containing protein [Rhodospirillales bacterium]|nr:DUF1476 domain-containing protein [Alphaproteobacteria bacterium]MCB9987022.1 DUF1476 domain-containing protein [Rhodospirillales bacterium]USO08208.1 MAG: DUF1476 domain-containing protein [Rhodospirillales bacterium]